MLLSGQSHNSKVDLLWMADTLAAARSVLACGYKY